jgi:hypothetical protein
MELQWVKAIASQDGRCVEVARTSRGGYAVRDSKDPDGPVLAGFTAQEWECFESGIRLGEFRNLPVPA